MNTLVLPPWVRVPVLAILLVLSVPVLMAGDRPDEWLERDTGYFHFLYQARDRAFVDILESLSTRVRCTTAGFLAWDCPGPVTVVVRGNNTNLAWAGYFSPMPYRMVLNASAGFDPFSLFVHEFTHYAQSRLPQGPLEVLSWFFGPEVKSANLPLAPHSLEGVTSFLDGSREGPWGIIPVKALMYQEKTWDWEEFWWSDWHYPWNLRVYLGGALFQAGLEEEGGSQAFARVWDGLLKGLLSEEAAVKAATGIPARDIWTRKLQALRREWSADFAIPGGQPAFPLDPEKLVQVYKTRTAGKGRLVYQTSGREFHDRFEVLEPGGTTRVLPGLDRTVEARDWDLNPDGSTLVTISSTMNDGSLETESNQTMLSIWQLDGDLRLVSRRTGQVHDAAGTLSIESPALDPAGRQLVCVARRGMDTRLGLVDMDSLLFTPLEGLEAVLEAAWAPDGKSLALVKAGPEGGRNLGRWWFPGPGEKTGRLEVFARDGARDFSPGFTPDGDILFASDRQDRVAVYRLHGSEVSLFLEDPVGAWGAQSGGADGKTWYYLSARSGGYVLLSRKPGPGTPAEGFFSLQPHWLQVLEDRRARYREAGEKIITRAADAPGSDHGLTDLALPLIWYPRLSWDSRGPGLGATVLAYSFLQENNWSLSAVWFPQWNLPLFNLDLGLHIPSFDLSASASWDWYRIAGTSGQNDSFIYRFYSGLGLDTRLAALQDETGYQVLSASLGGRFMESRTSSGPLDFASSLDGTWQKAGIFSALVNYTWSDLGALEELYGSSRVSVQARWQGLVSDSGFDQAAALRTEFRLDMGSGVLGSINLDASAGMGLGLGANLLVNSWTSSWLEPGTPVFDLRPELLFQLPLGLYTGRLAILPSDRSGISLGAATHFAADDWTGIAWNQKIELMCWFTEGTRYLYTSLPLRIQVGYRLDFSGGGLGAFDPSSLVLGLRFSSFDLLTASPGEGRFHEPE